MPKQTNIPTPTRPDAYTKPLLLIIPLITTTIAILIMPFASLISLFLMFPAFLTMGSEQKRSPDDQISDQAKKRLNQNRFLLWGAIFEFLAFMLITTIWPQALNWW